MSLYVIYFVTSTLTINSINNKEITGKFIFWRTELRNALL